ncbi:MAG TPA: GlyGly-CTERM sorting domain-containing protein [Polyangiaceae bacterium LLY-WYZ-15_(1-7)]|nr:type III secretion protein [Sandaracinus sp.]HJL02614.1 GlyGly-CTERM sorting domain-containing protein [Polyangiaceae bacterium LLY-WYZ-15_(1-7)]MBJ73774.1 type III secretion protein [Sandaracinus sp.]HJL11284.1 GlyGly-CTERM sorting domain-containing protein [Polyangiaceae bacterium LLY-WYZ-15_(1-7)]HJL26429.1 GlyGly-CTERM sorting domain-containing protein [Polyangiaceae bacterium LLY-WYZ-15_(1-7)]
MRSLLAPLLAATLALGCRATLQNDLSENEADQVLVALHGQGIGAAKEPAGGTGEARYTVTVSPEEVAPALEILRAEGLPRDDAPGLNEVFGEGGLVPTATEERARYVAALSGELSRSLRAIDGVIDARVHVALPDRRRIALDEDAPRPRASVLLKYRGAPPYEEEAVRALVAGAVQGMEPTDVAVVGVEASPAPERREANLVNLGPVTVTRGSSTALKAILGGALGLHLVLALLLVLAWRRRNAPPEPADEAAAP